MGRPLDPDVVSWLTNRRRLGGVVAVAVAAVAVAHLALKDQVLSAIARLAGGSWSAAVVMGWVVYAVPAAIAVAYLVLVRNRLSVAARRAALVVVGLLFVPAVSLAGPVLRLRCGVPGRARRGRADRPSVEGRPDGGPRLQPGRRPARAVDPRQGPRLARGGAGRDLARRAGARLSAAAPKPPPPKLLAEALAGAARFEARNLHLSAIEQTSGCAGATADQDTDQVLRRHGCVRTVRLVLATRDRGTPVAASVVEMPEGDRASASWDQLFRFGAPRPLRPRTVLRETATVGTRDRYVVLLAALPDESGRSPSPDEAEEAVGEAQRAIEAGLRGIGE